MGALPQLSRIDCHIHYMPSGVGEQLHSTLSSGNPLRSMVASRPAWRDLNVHVGHMNEAGVATAVVLEYGSELAVGLRGLGGSLNEAYELYNRSMSQDLARTGGRFISVAAVDPFGGKDAIAQLDRSLNLPALVGIGLVASYGGISLDDPVFEPIFDVARHHDVPILVHPSSVPNDWVETLRLHDLFLRAGLGFLLDDALCIFRMIVNGTFDRHPDLRFMFCQLGGLVPFCCGRWVYHREQAQQLHQERCVPLPSWQAKSLEDCLSRIWLDTHTQDRYAIQLTLAEAGEQVVVLGGDHPYTPYEGGVPYAVAEIESLGLPSATVAKLANENALALLGDRGRAAFKAATSP